MKVYDAAKEPPRYKDALRGKPVVIRLVVCLIAFAIPIALMVVADNLLHFWGSGALVGGAGVFLFVMLAVGPLHDLGAVDLGYNPSDHHSELPTREYVRPFFTRNRKRRP